ncbi:hypothetical protein SBC2_81490 (plasmid) [Caballeronia sp. SBC2]|nr:hypothetical protein SBC2_81490 [Caballeronia sp. SBC2]
MLRAVRLSISEHTARTCGDRDNVTPKCRNVRLHSACPCGNCLRGQTLAGSESMRASEFASGRVGWPHTEWARIQERDRLENLHAALLTRVRETFDLYPATMLPTFLLLFLAMHQR